MRFFALTLAAVALSGCATSAHAGEPDATYTSAKAPAEIAACVDQIRNTSTREIAPGHFRIQRKNGFGIALVTWNIRATATGSSIEYDAKVGIATGRGDAERCF